MFRYPISRAAKKLPLNEFGKFNCFVIWVYKLSNVRKDRENVNIASKNVEEETGVQLLPTPDSVSSFANGGIPHDVVCSWSKKETEIFCRVGDFEGAPFGCNAGKQCAKFGDFGGRIGKRDNIAFSKVKFEAGEIAKGLKKLKKFRKTNLDVGDDNTDIVGKGCNNLIPFGVKDKAYEI